MKDSCVCEPYIIRRSERDRSAYVESGVRSEDDPGGVHEIEVGRPEICRFNGAEDVRWVAASDTTENIRGCYIRSFVKEVGDVVGRDSELAEAVKEISACSSSTCDVELCAPSHGDRAADLRI